MAVTNESQDPIIPYVNSKTKSIEEDLNKSDQPNQQNQIK